MQVCQPSLPTKSIAGDDATEKAPHVTMSCARTGLSIRCSKTQSPPKKRVSTKSSPDTERSQGGCSTCSCGMEVGPWNPDHRTYCAIAFDGRIKSSSPTAQVSAGLRMVQIEAGTPAARAGLQSGDILTRVDGMAVSNVDEVFNLLRLSGGHRLTVLRSNQRIILHFQLTSENKRIFV
eukprot:gb/GEZN01009419.1/.p1 GENE.gb/GEZN01009419.1/~~gb/GEZN01009419.1/.p1  ORF type:complete len:178 (+),score=1.64 gb/GEZN01009419.1/:712-1245(+)